MAGSVTGLGAAWGQWVGLAVTDGIPGFWRALGEVFPETRHQRCWVHMIRNVLDKLPKARQQQTHKDLVRIYEAGSKAEAVNWIVYIADQYRSHPPAVKRLLES